MQIPSTARLVNYSAGLNRPAPFYNRVAYYQLLEKHHPDLFRVVQFCDPKTGELLRSAYGHDIFAVVIEDQKDKRPKSMTLTNVDPHGGEKQVEGYCQARSDLVLDDPSTIDGQCHFLYFGGIDSRRFRDASNVVDFITGTDDDGEKKKPFGARLQHVGFQTGWTQIGQESPGWIGLELTAQMVLKRTRRNDRLVMFISGHNSELGRNNYIRLGTQHDRTSRGSYIRNVARTLEAELTRRLGMQWNNRIFDDPNARPIAGTNGSFPLHFGSARRATDAPNHAISDIDLIADLFAGQPPVIMAAFEFADCRLVIADCLSTSQRRELAERLNTSTETMAKMHREIANWSRSSSADGPFLQQLQWYSGQHGGPNDSFVNFHLADPSDDVDTALFRSMITNFWTHRDYKSAAMLNATHSIMWDGPNPGEGRHIDFIELTHEARSLLKEGFYLLPVRFDEAVAMQTAAVDLTYKLGLNRDLSHELDGVDARFLDAIRRNQSDTPWEPTILNRERDFSRSLVG